VAASRTYNNAIEAYNNNNLEKAERLYNLIFQVIPYDDKKNLQRNNITPESINKELYFIAIKAKDNAKAKSYLQKLIDKNYSDPFIYIYMSRIYLNEKDTAKAIDYISKGRYIFEENKDLINEELRIYIAKGDVNTLIEKLTKAIEVDPEREVLYFNRATLYDQKKNIDKAAIDYKKAIELKADYFDAYYNLGAMYFNQAAEMLNAANNLKSDAEYSKAKAKTDAKFKTEALPYLEKANELLPNDKNTLISLKQLYLRIGDTAKLAKVTAALNTLK
jgi:tetratricopeptide (TPR) repeat protein